MASNLPIAETVGMALTTLRANRLRSVLTMLGIVIGNASVITLVGVGRGAQNLAESQLSTLGANVLFVCLLYTSPSPRDLSTSRMPSSA